MELSADGRRAVINVSGTFSAHQVENLIYSLMELRARMLPAVAPAAPTPGSIVKSTPTIQPDPHMAVVIEKDGVVELWLRNEGVGWLRYDLSADNAHALAEHILDSAELAAQQSLLLSGNPDVKPH